MEEVSDLSEVVSNCQMDLEMREWLLRNLIVKERLCQELILNLWAQATDFH